MKKIVIRNILGVILIGILYYFLLPPINIKASEFWFFLCFISVVFFIVNIKDSKWTVTKNNVKFDSAPKYMLVPLIIIPVVIVGTMLINLIVSPFFNSKSWANRINVQTGDFTKEIKEVDFNTLPLLDKVSSQKLGDRTMGQNSEYVSQYYVSDLYTQINYKDDIVRVTPIEYDGIIKWFINRKNGINAYITVNSVNGESKLVKVENGLKYMPSAHFNDKLARKLRFSYPTTIFGEPRFEVDDNGRPYWVVPTLNYAGISSKESITGAVILDPATGESNKYDLKDIPTWVDNVYYADLVIEMIDNWGEYQGGFFNSFIGQKNVTNTTRGYNYLALDNDIYLYTGITSVVSDESNLGFVLTNLRTGDTKYYDVPGAEEYSAMDSAKGQVQQMNYDSTFPLLINLNNKPTYLVSLKDNAGLVKMYAFIDVQDYQKVVVTDVSEGINKAAVNYLKRYSDNSANNSIVSEKNITVKSISSAVKDGNTWYYITDTENKKYKIKISASDKLPFITNGNKLTIFYYEEKEITEIVEIK